jgi:hypothetical protein
VGSISDREQGSISDRKPVAHRLVVIVVVPATMVGMMVCMVVEPSSGWCG